MSTIIEENGLKLEKRGDLYVVSKLDCDKLIVLKVTYSPAIAHNYFDILLGTRRRRPAASTPNGGVSA